MCIEFCPYCRAWYDDDNAAPAVLNAAIRWPAGLKRAQAPEELMPEMEEWGEDDQAIDPLQPADQADSSAFPGTSELAEGEMNEMTSRSG